MACRIRIKYKTKVFSAERIISRDYCFDSGAISNSCGNSCGNSTCSSLDLARSSGNCRVKKACYALSFALERVWKYT